MILIFKYIFQGQPIQWIPFQNYIYDGHFEIQDGRPGPFNFILISF